MIVKLMHLIYIYKTFISWREPKTLALCYLLFYLKKLIYYYYYYVNVGHQEIITIFLSLALTKTHTWRQSLSIDPCTAGFLQGCTLDLEHQHMSAHHMAIFESEHFTGYLKDLLLPLKG